MPVFYGKGPIKAYNGRELSITDHISVLSIPKLTKRNWSPQLPVILSRSWFKRSRPQAMPRETALAHAGVYLNRLKRAIYRMEIWCIAVRRVLFRAPVEYSWCDPQTYSQLHLFTCCYSFLSDVSFLFSSLTFNNFRIVCIFFKGKYFWYKKSI